MVHLSLSLLGPFQATLDGQPIAGFRATKVRALLAYLAVEAHRYPEPHPHPRTALAALLWPDRSERAALANLRNALANLRQAIGDRTRSGDRDAGHPFLQVTRDTIHFDLASDYWLDVAAFQELVETTETDRPVYERLEEAVSLYRGGFLHGFFVRDSPDFEDWALLVRERLQRQVLTALHRLTAYYESSGEVGRACEAARRQVALAPWEEEAHRQLMRLLALSGQRGGALAQYEVCRRALREELDVEPEEETIRLYARIRDEQSGPPTRVSTVAAGSRDSSPYPVLSALQDGPAAQLEASPPFLQQAGGWLQSERRIITALVADVKGLSVLSEQVDVETWVAIRNETLKILTAEISRYGGEVDRFRGNRLVALFGVPAVHEDDPERAVLAALAMQEGLDRYTIAPAEQQVADTESPIELVVRVGVNTGEVIAATVGDRRQHGGETAIGPTIALAAQLVAAAAPGTVLVAEQTHRLAVSLFEWQPCGEIAVEGASHPVRVYRPTAHLATRGKGRGIEGLSSPLVGRGAELQALREAVGRLRAGFGGIVTMVGEAGIGKSRLVAEARVWAGGQNASPPPASDSLLPDPRWIEGRCLSYGTNTAYGLWLDLLHGWLSMAPDASPLTVREALRGRVHSLCPNGEEDVYPYLGRMLALPLEEEIEAKLRGLEAASLRFVTFRAVEIVLTRAAQARPLVVVCEDLHWADPTSIDLLERLLALTDRVPLLFLCVLRPETEQGCWRIVETAARLYRHRHTHLRLASLSLAESETLVNNLLYAADLYTEHAKRLSVPSGREGLPEELCDRVLDYAEGNPFYVEEILRSLIDNEIIVYDEGADRQGHLQGCWRVTRNVDDIAIPDTLNGVLVARIDRLPVETKRVLRLASVIGRVFSHRVLAEIAQGTPLSPRGEATGVGSGSLDPHLLALQREGFVRGRARIPELEYIFKHELTREAAYNGLLRRERPVYHRQVAEALKRLLPDRIEEQVGLLAYHYEQAEEWDKALEYLVRAGDRAAAAYANEDALAYYARALEVCEQVGDADLQAYNVARKRGEVHAHLRNARGIADFDRMLVFARKLGDRHREGLALAYRGWAERLSLDHEAAERTLLEALEVAGEAFEDVRLLAAATLANMYLYSDRHAEAKSLLSVIGELTPRAGSHLPVLLHCWNAIGSFSPNWEGRFDDALAFVDRARNVAAQSEDAVLIFGFSEALARGGRGEYEHALKLLNEVIAHAERIGEVSNRARAPNVIGWIHGEIQDHEQAMAWNRRGVEDARRAGFPNPEAECNALINLADNLMALGRLDEAETYLLPVERVVRHPRPKEKQLLWRYSQHFFHSYGELWLMRGDHGRALAYADECLALAERSNSRKNIVKARRLRGQAFLAQGQLTASEQELLTALVVAQQVGNPPQLWKTWAVLGELRQAQGRPEDARQAYGNALLVIDRVADGLTECTRRDTFLRSRQVQEIRQAEASIR